MGLDRGGKEGPEAWLVPFFFPPGGSGSGRVSVSGSGGGDGDGDGDESGVCNLIGSTPGGWGFGSIGDGTCKRCTFGGGLRSDSAFGALMQLTSCGIGIEVGR